jgi:predicted negative regulator of RcsB-dependent stress response
LNLNNPPALSSDQPISREVVVTLIKTSLACGELRYVRRLCSAWLAVYPGDIPISLLYAQSYLKDKLPTTRLLASPILEELCTRDPEFTEAQEMLANAHKIDDSPKYLIMKACANALTHGHSAKTAGDQSISSWAKNVYEARTALDDVKKGDYQKIEKAEYYIHKALVENQDAPLAAVVHLRLVESQSSMPKIAVRNLSQIYHERWPECLQFSLSLADQLMESGESTEAVSLLHQAAARDVTGQVAVRMWGVGHPYRAMWPDNLIAENDGPNSPQNIPIPAGVASSLGWNQISAGFSGVDLDPDGSLRSEKDHSYYPAKEFSTAVPIEATRILSEDESPKLSPSSKDVADELEKMADELRRPHIVHEDGRFPVYVIFTTRGGLNAQYGNPSAVNIDAYLQKLAKVIQGRKIGQEFWGSLLFYADDPTCTGSFNLTPAPYNDAWQLKLTLSNLDAALNKQGERIGAVLIVGGPEVVPFHNLPNPVEDADVEVPSDNPYSAKDTNYFISDWPVGRVSAGSGSKAENLIKLVKEISNQYDMKAVRPAWYIRLVQRVREFFKAGLSKKLSSFGYTAAVWKMASLSVFRPIGNPSDLIISPPVHACDPIESLKIESNKPASNTSPSCLLMPETQLAYFNLHGVPDSSEWYGQCDPTQPGDGPEFPVAMRPQDIRNSGSAPKMVFTEACYGTNILGKSIEDAISLKFLSSGTQAIVGSTCISYGALSTPLSAADLLGQVFWNLLQEGFTAGESLRRAKIHLTREMNQRQGFLDAEDQKTLISFVLFGDPLAQPFRTKVAPKISPHLSDSAVPVATVCERSCEGEAGSTVPMETITHLKGIVSQYLPGMSDAQVYVSHEHQRCGNGKCGCGKQCQFSKLTPKKQSTGIPRRRVVTLSKNFESAQRKHTQYARLTLDERGKIVKMVVSH